MNCERGSRGVSFSASSLVMFYLPKMQWVRAVLLLSKPSCVCICVFGGREKWGARASISTCIHSPDPTDAFLPSFFASVSLPQTFFAPAAALPELFPLPSDSFSAVVRLSPLPCSFLLRIPHSLSLWLVRTLPLLLPHSLSGLP